MINELTLYFTLLPQTCALWCDFLYIPVFGLLKSNRVISRVIILHEN